MKMKLFCIVALLFILPAISRAQKLDESIKLICNDLAEKLNNKHISKVALLDFTDQEKKQNSSISYIQEQVEYNLINSASLSIIDRDHIKEMLKENDMVSAGLIDEKLAKKAVSFLNVEAWVIGEITDFGSSFKIKMKVINLNTSQIFAASTSGLIDASELNKIMAPKNCLVCSGTGMIKTILSCATCKGTGGDPCEHCSGTGKDAIGVGLGNGNAKCQFCGGKGKKVCATCKGDGQIIGSKPCTKCNGTGKQI